MAWPYNLVVEQEPTSPGAVALASGDPTNPGTIWIATLDGEGVDHEADYAELGEGDLVRLTDAVDATLWHEHLCTTAPTISAGVAEIVGPVHMADGSPGKVLAVGAITVTVPPADPAGTGPVYEIMEVRVELGDRVPGTPVELPAGWTPMQAERRSGEVVVLLMRQK